MFSSCISDFFQLPPVKKGAAPKYCFEAKAWTKAVKRAVVLKQVFRQKNEEFVDILNEVRTANLSEASVAKLEEAKHHTLLSEPTRLFAHNARADAMAYVTVLVALLLTLRHQTTKMAPHHSLRWRSMNMKRILKSNSSNLMEKLLHEGSIARSFLLRPQEGQLLPVLSSH